MGRRGPAPKPTALKLLAGNPGRRPLPSDEPVPEASGGAVPDWLGDDARQIWFALAPALVGSGVLRKPDEGVLGRYCTVLARWLVCKKVVERGKTYIVIKNKAGTVVGAKEIPEAQEFRRLLSPLIQLERELGLTPASRTRIQRERESAAGNDVADLKRSFFAAPPLSMARPKSG